jgi:hypothetical protein
MMSGWEADVSGSGACPLAGLGNNDVAPDTEVAVC